MNFITFVFSLMFLLSYLSPRIMTQAIPYMLLLLLFGKISNKLIIPKELKYINLLFIISLLALLINNFYPLNFFIGWYTLLGGFLVFLLAYNFYSEIDIKKITYFYLFLSFIQIPIGMIQVYKEAGLGAYGSLIYGYFSVLNTSFGDFFTGTYFAPLKTSHIIGIKLSIALIIVLISQHLYLKPKVRTFLIISFTTGIIFSQNMHVILCLFITLLLYIFRNKITKFSNFEIFFLISIILIIFYLSIGIFFGDVYLLEYFVIQFLKIEHLLSTNSEIYFSSPRKILALLDTIQKLPELNPISVLIGTGIGNYSSYAAQTGNSDILLKPIYTLDYPNEFWRIIYPKWNIIILSKPYNDGVANQPWFTYLTILGEFGYIGLILFLTFIIQVFKKIKKIVNYSSDIILTNFALILVFFSIYVFLLYFFDNYHEDPRITTVYFTYLGYVFGRYDSSLKNYASK